MKYFSRFCLLIQSLNLSKCINYLSHFLKSNFFFYILVTNMYHKQLYKCEFSVLTRRGRWCIYSSLEGSEKRDTH